VNVVSVKGRLSFSKRKQLDTTVNLLKKSTARIESRERWDIATTFLKKQWTTVGTIRDQDAVILSATIHNIREQTRNHQLTGR